MTGALFLTYILGFAALSQALQTPVLVWSNAEFGKHRISNTYSYQDLSLLLQSMYTSSKSTQNSVFHDVRLAHNPDAVIMFVARKLQTTDIQENANVFSPINKLVSQSKSSVIAPWMEYAEGDSVVGLLKESLANFGRVIIVTREKDGKILDLVHSHSDVQHLQVSDITASSFVSAKKPVLAIVDLPSNDFNADVSIIADTNSKLEAAGVEFVAVLTAEEPSQLDSSIIQPTNARGKRSKTSATNNSGFRSYTVKIAQENSHTASEGEGDWTDWFPFWFWEGLLFGIAFVWVTLCGTCLVMDIQTHDTYMKPGKLKQN